MADDVERVEKLKQIYGHPDKCDIWVGIIS